MRFLIIHYQMIFTLWKILAPYASIRTYLEKGKEILDCLVRLSYPQGWLYTCNEERCPTRGNLAWSWWWSIHKQLQVQRIAVRLDKPN